MTDVTMKELLEAGVHFGHQRARWNPKMRPFIFTERAGVHIFDLEITLAKFKEALAYLEKQASEGKTVLFVATKKQAQDIVRGEAKRADQPYIVDRWLGGTLTNFRTLSDRIKRLKELEEKRGKGEFENLTKKERLGIDEEINKLNKAFEGIKDMSRPPDVLFVIDIIKENLAVREAKKLGVKIVGVCDSNADPDMVDYCIPANDDAVRAIALIASEAAEAILRGKGLAQKKVTEGHPELVEGPQEPPAETKPKAKPRAKKVKSEETGTDVIPAEAGIGSPIESGMTGEKSDEN